MNRRVVVSKIDGEGTPRVVLVAQLKGTQVFLEGAQALTESLNDNGLNEGVMPSDGGAFLDELLRTYNSGYYVAEEREGESV